MTQGYLQASAWTERKQFAFRFYISAWAAIASAIQRKYSWVGRCLYFELTAGSGLIQSETGLLAGSPLIALRAFLQQPTLAIDCVFVEHNPAYAEQLRMAINADRRLWTASDLGRISVSIHCQDHCNLLENSNLVGLPMPKLGLVYWDGLGGDIYPSQELRHWFLRHHHQDLLVMASANAQKRMGRTRFDRMLLTAPRDVFITDTNGAWEWIFALMTGWRPLADKLGKAGFRFHDGNSPEGQQIRDKLGLTREQRSNRDQMGLFSEYQTYDDYLKHPKYLAVRAEAIRRAKGRCEVCGALATEVHHLRYPPWGEFDIVENLLAVCHSCHCRIEAKA